jgi:transposase
MEQAIMIGLDIAKNVFEVHGRSAAGEVVLRRTVRRRHVEKEFSRLAPAVIGMEACGSAHHWGRVLGKLGHEVRLMPPAYVKPYVKRNKSDAIDAAACWEAVGRPNMRFVPLKTVEQQAALSLHRSRELLVRQRTQLGNALRALLAEFGIVAGQGKAGLAHLVELLRAGTLELPEDAVLSATVLADQRAALDAAAETLERRIKAQAKANKTARMLQTAPTVGPLTAHAVLAILPDPARFKCGRDFAAFRQDANRPYHQEGRLIAATAACARRHQLGAPHQPAPRQGLALAARHAGPQAQEARRRRPGRPHRPRPMGHAHPQPALSRAGQRLSQDSATDLTFAPQTHSQGAQQH